MADPKASPVQIADTVNVTHQPEDVFEQHNLGSKKAAGSRVQQRLRPFAWLLVLSLMTGACYLTVLMSRSIARMIIGNHSPLDAEICPQVSPLIPRGHADILERLEEGLSREGSMDFAVEILQGAVTIP